MAVNLGEIRLEKNEIDLLLGEIYRVPTTDHNQLLNRDMANQHSIESITNLKPTLDEVHKSIEEVKKTSIEGFLTDFEIQEILNT